MSLGCSQHLLCGEDDVHRQCLLLSSPQRCSNQAYRPRRSFIRKRYAEDGRSDTGDRSVLLFRGESAPIQKLLICACFKGVSVSLPGYERYQNPFHRRAADANMHSFRAARDHIALEVSDVCQIYYSNASVFEQE